MPVACSGTDVADQHSSASGQRRGQRPERTASADRSWPQERVCSWPQEQPARIAAVAARTAAELRTVVVVPHTEVG